MHIHHFYPRTNNIGDHFVQRGIEAMVRRLRPDASFSLFDVNDRGVDKAEFGLTQRAIERANSEADLVIVGGSNLYEGNYRWHWGIHLEAEALAKLRVRLLLLGIGTGSGFGAPLHASSKRAISEIRLLNEYATLSGARDVVTLAWLHELGITKAELTGDPATFIFNHPLQRKAGGYLLMAIPPLRFWKSLHRFWSVRRHGRTMFRALVSLVPELRNRNREVVVACSDRRDMPLAKSLFAGSMTQVVCPATPEEYFQLLAESSALVSGRLHSAVVALSLGVPFILFNVDQRTEGFIRTYQLEDWCITPARGHTELALQSLIDRLLSEEAVNSWNRLVEAREAIHMRANQAIARCL